MAIKFSQPTFTKARCEIAVAFVAVSVLIMTVLVVLFLSIHHPGMGHAFVDESKWLFSHLLTKSSVNSDLTAHGATHALALKIVSFLPMIAGALLAAGFLFAFIILRPVERAIIVQRQLIAEASHELKTPLASAQLNAEALISDVQLDSRARSRVEFVLGAIEQISRLVSDLFWLAKQENPVREYSYQKCDVTSLCLETANNFLPQFELKSIRFERSIETAIATCDSAAMKTMLTNLLSNALKYTEGGGIVRLSVKTTPNSVLIEVGDNGVGIQSESMPYIFDRFYRSADARVMDGGNGLGLAIVKAIVDAHGGKIHVQSSEISGTKFTIELPMSGPRHKWNWLFSFPDQEHH